MSAYRRLYLWFMFVCDELSLTLSCIIAPLSSFAHEKDDKGAIMHGTYVFLLLREEYALHFSI